MRVQYLIIGQILLYSSICSSIDQPCPNDMVLVNKNLCIDKFESSNKIGVKPFVYASGIKEDNTKFMDAETICKNAGKRVCTRKEWIEACSGPDHLKYPYGNKYDPEACNTEKKWLKVDYDKIAKRDRKHLSNLDQSEPSGQREKCVSPIGAYDMVGNAEEWVKCDTGEYGWCLVGGYWASGQKPSCKYSVIKHAPNWHDYCSAARCCFDIKEK